MGEALSGWRLAVEGGEALLLRAWHAPAPPGSRRLRASELLSRLPRLLAETEARSILLGVVSALAGPASSGLERRLAGAPALQGGARAERRDQHDALRSALALAIESGRLVGYQLRGLGGGGGPGAGKPHSPPPIEPPPTTKPPVPKTPPGKPPLGKPVEPVTVQTVTILSVTVITDHQLMCQSMLWLNLGEPYPKPEWKAGVSQPVSHTMGLPVGLRLELVIGPEGAAPAPGILRGMGPAGLRFETPPLLLSPGPMTVEVTSDGPLPSRVRVLSLAIQWSAERLSSAEALAVTPTQTAIPMYLTFDRPRDEYKGTGETDLHQVGAEQFIFSQIRDTEDGVTLRRMASAVSWVEPIANQSLHEVAATLVGKINGYELIENREDVPLLYNHPSYRNALGGAWPLWEFSKYRAECQAIVRLARAILRQLGAPADPRMVMIWVDPEIAGGAEVLEADWEDAPEAGLDATRTIGGVKQEASLVDVEVAEGNTYSEEEVGSNRFEACLKLVAEGKTRYYPGGTSEICSHRDEVIKVLWGLVWIRRLEGGRFVVEQIVRKLREAE